MEQSEMNMTTATDNRSFFEKVDLMLDTLLHTLLADVTPEEPGLVVKLFPKTCNCCGTVYHSNKEYMDQTAPLNKNIGNVLVSSLNCWVEYRNCHCGSTLVIVSQNVRDASPSGQRKRDYFQECVEKIGARENAPIDKIRLVVRHVFRKTLYNR